MFYLLDTFLVTWAQHRRRRTGCIVVGDFAVIERWLYVKFDGIKRFVPTKQIDMGHCRNLVSHVCRFSNACRHNRIPSGPLSMIIMVDFEINKSMCVCVEIRDNYVQLECFLFFSGGNCPEIFASMNSNIVQTPTTVIPRSQCYRRKFRVQCSRIFIWNTSSMRSSTEMTM